MEPISPTSIQTGNECRTLPTNNGEVKIELSEHPGRRRLGDPPSVADNAFQTMTASTFSGLSLLRPAIESAAITSRNNLCAASHDAELEITALKSKFVEEKERLKYLNRRLSEKADNLRRAREEHDRACAVLRAARLHDVPLDGAQVTSRKQFLRHSQALEKSLNQNVTDAENRKNTWEFKTRRQQVVIDKIMKNITEAEEKHKLDCAKIDSDLADIQAVLDLMKQV